jgi:hypothetical protein
VSYASINPADQQTVERHLEQRRQEDESIDTSNHHEILIIVIIIVFGALLVTASRGFGRCDVSSSDSTANNCNTLLGIPTTAVTSTSSTNFQTRIVSGQFANSYSPESAIAVISDDIS